MNIIKEMYVRAKSETPEFWKKLRTIWAWITSISAVIVGLEVAEIEILTKVMPRAIASHVADISKYAAAVGVISMLQTKLAVKHNPEVK